ncbi:hypothetical protein SISNIDRAFT_256433 [Sistotremastrum niveocremeum HHB9708]|uniref:Uncharacterized protein n=1 Tax=Sistotremastrum niveocremeum HHB9708 TaxID=1314777 RepID=A0A164PHI0_9AGAM|nr:hypothetical protein SISNIDRAFT_256433 [Sistotremastrum niveocremeum HHB9708]
MIASVKNIPPRSTSFVRSHYQHEPLIACHIPRHGPLTFLVSIRLSTSLPTCKIYSDRPRPRNVMFSKLVGMTILIMW